MFPSPLLRMEKMLPGLRLPKSLNPFLIFPLDWDSQDGGSAFSVCTSIFSQLPPFFMSSGHLLLLFCSWWCNHINPELGFISVCSLALPLTVFLYWVFVSLPLSIVPIQSFLFYSSLESPSPLPRFFVWLLSTVAMATEELSSFRQQCGARGCDQPTLNAVLSSSLSDDNLHKQQRQILHYSGKKRIPNYLYFSGPDECNVPLYAYQQSFNGTNAPLFL